MILITDGLPTAHFEGKYLYLLYPPHRRTEEATMREGRLCQREGITINIFLLPSWSQSREDVQFAYRLAESTARPRVLHRRQGAGPVCGMGLSQSAAGIGDVRSAKRGTGTFCAKHPKGRSGKRCLSPFSPFSRRPRRGRTRKPRATAPPWETGSVDNIQGPTDHHPLSIPHVTLIVLDSVPFQHHRNSS